MAKKKKKKKKKKKHINSDKKCAHTSILTEREALTACWGAARKKKEKGMRSVGGMECRRKKTKEVILRLFFNLLCLNAHKRQSKKLFAKKM